MKKSTKISIVGVSLVIMLIIVILCSCFPETQETQEKIDSSPPQSEEKASLAVGETKSEFEKNLYDFGFRYERSVGPYDYWYHTNEANFVYCIAVLYGSKVDKVSSFIMFLNQDHYDKDEVEMLAMALAIESLGDYDKRIGNYYHWYYARVMMNTDTMSILFY